MFNNSQKKLVLGGALRLVGRALKILCRKEDIHADKMLTGLIKI